MDWRDRSVKVAFRFGPTLLVLIAFVTILTGIIFHAISINEHRYSDPPAQNFDPNTIIDDKPTDLVWFLQVTDLHISNWPGNQDRATEFKEFASTYLDIIKPDAVLVTGDITDGRIQNTNLGTEQQLDEWLAYEDAVSSSNALAKTVWLDLRGNHDNFNVYRPEDPNSLFRQHSVQGKHSARNYMYVLEKDGKKYSFIAVDEVQTPGIKAPFNFIGIVKDKDLAELREFKKLSKQHNSQYSIWFAHYPTSSIAAPNDGLRNIVDGPYLCGHFHTISNWVVKMHATQQPGFAEVELGDWKHNRRIRLAAIDHQLFSLMDAPFKQLPIALMTNPKTAEHMMPKFEPVDRIVSSTHVRVIAFSNATITRVELTIDTKPTQTMVHTNGPLYVHEWRPSELSMGLHTAHIRVTDSEEKTQTYRQTFSMDNSKEEFSIGARILIRAYFKSYVMAIFFFILTICTLPMLVLQIIAYTPSESGLKRHYRGTFLFNLHLLSNIPRLLWPLFMVPIWIAVGPLFVGHLVDETIGACFVWGVLIDGTFLHTGITYNLGSLYLLFIHVPVTILLSSQTGSCYDSIATSNAPASVKGFRLVAHFMVTALQLCIGSLVLSAYGAMSYFTSFPFFWSIFLYAFCWYQCASLKKSDFGRFYGSDNSDQPSSLADSRTRDNMSNISYQTTC